MEKESSSGVRRVLFAERHRYGSWHEGIDHATEPADFFHDAGAEIGVFLRRHEEDRLDLRLEFAVHQRHLKLELEVRNRAQPADDGRRALLARELDKQAVETGDADVFKPSDRARNQRRALGSGKKAAFLVIDGHGDDDLVEKLGCASDDVEVAIGHGVKAAGIDRASHAAQGAGAPGNYEGETLPLPETASVSSMMRSIYSWEHQREKDRYRRIIECKNTRTRALILRRI